jgi:hypothetical protein
LCHRARCCWGGGVWALAVETINIAAAASTRTVMESSSIVNGIILDIFQSRDRDK